MKTLILMLMSLLISFGSTVGIAKEATPIEHTPEDKFIYFTAIDGENSIEIELEKGEQEIMVTMDFGELWLRISKDDKILLDTDATFTANYDIQIDEAGTYTLTLIGKKASGSVNY